MTDREDDDDPQLRSLRAVWLSMPDEDPPAGGLADLMAAARAQAEHMARPSVWQRLGAVLRRPPVLALATIVVLVGGAVLIGTRHELASTKEAEQRAPGSSRTPPAVDDAVVTNGGELRSRAKAAPVDKVDVKGAEEPRPVMHGTIATTSVPPAKLATKAPARAAKPAPPAGDAEAKPATTAADPEMAQASALVQPPTTAQLVARCRSAAAHGDCAAVRALASRIANQDARVYQAQIAHDAAIAKCLGP